MSLFKNPESIIDYPDFYEWGKPELKERTRSRLTQIVEMGMTDIYGNASFGIKGVMSGLYIEKVWSYSDEAWNDYIEWVQSLIDEKLKNKNKKPKL